MKKQEIEKETKVFRWNGVSRDEGTVVEIDKKYISVDWQDDIEKIEKELFRYQVTMTADGNTWRWNAPPNDAETFTTKLEGDWENTYNNLDKMVATRLLTTPWFLQPPYDFLIDEGYTVTPDNAASLQHIIEGKWVDTYYWFYAACGDKKQIGDEVIKWMIGPLKEIMDEDGGLKHHSLGFMPMDLGELVSAVVDKKITATMGKEVLARMHDGELIDEILKDDKYKVSSGDDMIKFVKDVIDANPDQIAELMTGKDKILGWLVGQVMKESKGKANAGDVNKMFREELKL